MLGMQEIAFPGFKFQKYSGVVCPQTPLFMHGMSATHMAFFRHCYSPNILSHRKVPFQEMSPPPTEKSLKKALKYTQQSSLLLFFTC
jgi:hypothetical protein